MSFIFTPLSSSRRYNQGGYISINNPGNSRCFRFLNHKFVQTESDHLWLLYIHPECFSENEIADLSELDENGIIHMEVEFDCKPTL